jgi:hypothetical protein
LTGDGTLSANLSGLAAGTQYAVRFAVQSAAGTGKSSIHLFATEAAYPNVTLALATGASNIATVTAGQTATYSMVASDGGNGYIGTATLTCSGAPTGATCTISPSQFTVNTTATPITVTVTTTGATTAQAQPAFGGLNWAFSILLGTGILAYRKKLRNGGFLLILAALALSVVSCGGGGSGGISGGGVTSTPTPAGTYYLMLTEAAGGKQNPAHLLTLTVQ